MYDKNNIFAKILREEIPCVKVYEDKFAFAFKDINPQAKVHVLVIPKGAYVDMNDFAANAKSDEIEGLIRALGKVANILGVSDSGYRYLGNNGRDGAQEVPHLHFHILGGEKLIKSIHK
jgi:diadenosine tetraphosphate (Ap4A) HIT family hydrolase